jgi:hypothetical protein
MTYDHPVPVDTDAVPCRRDPERMFPVGNGASREAQDHAAKAVCRFGNGGHHCPLFSRCLRFSVRHSVDGIWASTTPEERQKIRDRTGVEAIPLYLSPSPARAS